MCLPHYQVRFGPYLMSWHETSIFIPARDAGPVMAIKSLPGDQSFMVQGVAGKIRILMDG